MNANHASPDLRRFIALYACANIGVVMVFIPLLTLILPIKVNAIDPDNKVVLLSAILCIGGVMASISNIISGWLSDRTFQRQGHRFGQIFMGLIATILSFYIFWCANDWVSLIIAIIIFQLSLNLLYAPMAALLTDYIPDQNKGRVAAYLNMGVPMASFVVAVLALTIFDTEAARLSAIALLLLLMVLPLLWLARLGKIPPTVQNNQLITALPVSEDADPVHMPDLRWAWISRFFIQFSGAMLFGYIVYYLQDIVGYAAIFPDETVDQGVGILNILAIPFGITAGLGAGYISDHIGVRRPFLYGTAASIALALAMLAYIPSWPLVIFAFTLFSAAIAAFQTIDTALVTQIIAHSPKRARIMGYMNLTNTLPTIITPALALILSSNSLPNQVIINLLTLSASLAVLAIFAISRIKSVK